MAHYNCVKWEIFENMQRGSVVGNRVRFLQFNAGSKHQLQHYIVRRPLQNSMHTTSFYYNRIGMVGLYIMQCWQ